VRVADSVETIRGFPLVFSATNSVVPVIGPGHLDRAPLVLCDVATPGDVDPAVASTHPTVVLIRGGRIHLPHRQQIEIGGMPACSDGVYACLAETILLGLSQSEPAASPPPSAAASVRQIMDLAQSHGFAIAAA
jgi:predicted amino acid dehydrogenase